MMFLCLEWGHWESKPFASLSNRVSACGQNIAGSNRELRTGAGVRTLTYGFGDRCAAVDTTSACINECLLELNVARLTSSPEPSRGLFLNRHAPCNYVDFLASVMELQPSLIHNFR